MKKLLIAIIAGAAFCGVPALAADMAVKAPPPPPPPAPVYSWTGFYVGGDVGALWTKANGVWDPLPDVIDFGEFEIFGDLNKTAFVGGLHAGYNWQFAPTWVVGIEGDWSWPDDAKTSFNQPWDNFITGIRPSTQTSMSIAPDWLATVRGRIGYLVTPSALLYFTGGGAWADVNYTASAMNEPAPTYVASTSFSKTVSGYVLGGGLEWVLWSHWSVRAEYLFYHLNTNTGVVTFDSTGNFPPFFASGFSWSNLDIQTARVGASYKF
jgi:outer membrane immunogenic protein